MTEAEKHAIRINPLVIDEHLECARHGLSEGHHQGVRHETHVLAERPFDKWPERVASQRTYFDQMEFAQQLGLIPATV